MNAQGFKLVHSLNGRLRVKIPQLKRTPAMAPTIGTHLQQLRGVTTVTVNPTTGSVLILYDVQQIHPRAIRQALEGFGYPNAKSPARQTVNGHVQQSQKLRREVIKTPAHSAAKALLTQPFFKNGSPQPLPIPQQGGGAVVSVFTRSTIQLALQGLLGVLISYVLSGIEEDHRE